MKKAFTLPEVMIVLVVIGVLTGILMPIAYHSAPDENVMKFKKANGTLGTVIREMVSSDMYYQDGNLELKIGGSAADAKYFCESMADILNYKMKNCTNNSGTDSSDYDAACSGNKTVQIITPDGVSWFMASSDAFSASGYKTVCFDVDGVGVGEEPFGYGIRADGKIIYGARAVAWTEKSIQRGE